MKYHYQKHIKDQHDPLIYDHLADHMRLLRSHEFVLAPSLGVNLPVISNFTIGADLVDTPQSDPVFVTDRLQAFVRSY